MTTTTTTTTPTFRVRGHLATLRGVLIVSACLALGTAFVAQSWSGPSSAALEHRAEVRS